MPNIFKDLMALPNVVVRETEGNIRRIMDWLVERGKLSRADALALLNDFHKLTKIGRNEWELRMDQFVRRKLHRLSFPRRGEMVALRQRVNQLIDRADALEIKWRRQNGMMED